MIPIERHQRILALVEQRGAVSINELTEILGVSHMTIRRDVRCDEAGTINTNGADDEKIIAAIKELSDATN